MANLIQCISKPRAGAQLNPAHPLATMLVFAALANEGDGKRLVNYFKNSNVPENTMGGVFGGSPWGGGAVITQGTACSGWLENSQSPTAVATANYTVSFVGMFQDVTTSIDADSFEDFFSKDASVNANFKFQRDRNNLRAGVVISSVGTYVTLSSYLTAFTPYVITLVVTQDTTTTYLSLYVNGVLEGTNSVVSLVPSVSLGIKVQTTTGDTIVTFDGGFYWQRAFSDEDAKLQASDPFAMFRRQWVGQISNSLGAGNKMLLRMMEERLFIRGMAA